MTLRSFYEHVFDTEVKLTGQRYTQAWDCDREPQAHSGLFVERNKNTGNTCVWPTKGELIYI